MATLGMRQQLKYQYGYSGNLPPRSLEHLGKIILDGFFKLEQLRGLSGILSDKDGLTERIWATILSPEADRLRSALKKDEKVARSQIRPIKAAIASSSSFSSSSSATLAPSPSHDEELQRQHEDELEVEEEGEMVMLDSRTQVEKVADDNSDASSVDSSDDSSDDNSDDSSDIDDSTNNDNDNTTDNNGGGGDDDDSDIIVLEPLDSLLL
jgi:hypothetical protein